MVSQIMPQLIRPRTRLPLLATISKHPTRMPLILVWQNRMLPTSMTPLADTSMKDYLRPPGELTLPESKAIPPSALVQGTGYCQPLSQPCYYSFLTWHQGKSLIQLSTFILQPCATCTLLLACIDLSRSNLLPDYSWCSKALRKLRLFRTSAGPTYPLPFRL